MGISPDGIIFQDGIITRAVEIKAPLGKNFIKYWLTEEIPSEYYWQVIMYFVVIESLQSLDFIVHSPHPYDARVRTKKIRVTREQLLSDIQRAEIAIFDFLAEFQALSALFIENVKKHTI